MLKLDQQEPGPTSIPCRYMQAYTQPSRQPRCVCDTHRTHRAEVLRMSHPVCLPQTWRHSSFHQRRQLIRIILKYVVEHQREICRCRPPCVGQLQYKCTQERYLVLCTTHEQIVQLHPLSLAPMTRALMRPERCPGLDACGQAGWQRSTPASPWWTQPLGRSW